MASRFPSGPGGSRYPRDRSPPRFDRHASGDPGHERNDGYAARGEGPKEPPRGPRAQTGRGGFAPRARAFREESFPRGRGRGQSRDWEPRDRFDARDRRASPPPRPRSRSPYRESRDPHANPRGGGMDSSAADAFPLRGRGGFRGRGRGDWDYNRAKSYHQDDRLYDQRSHSRDRARDLPPRDYIFAQSRRDEDTRLDREREREPFRPDSRNSYIGSRSTSSTPAQPSAQDFGPGPPGMRGALAASNREKRPTLDERAEKSLLAKEIERADISQRGNDNVLRNSRENSPVPPPSVPAFGTVLPPTILTSDKSSKPPREEGEVNIHPSRRALLEPSKEPRSPPSTSTLKAPTAPKLQQRLGQDDAARPASSNIGPTSTRSNDAPPESIPQPNWSQRFPQSGPLPAPRSAHQEQPSVRKALDEEGRNGNLAPQYNSRPSINEPNMQTSPMRIPTGPRAGRGAPPSIRNPMQPSMRGSMTTRGPTMLGRGRAQTTAWSWRNPALQHVAPKGPSIMNKVPTRRDIEIEEEKQRSSTYSTQSAVEQWRQQSAPFNGDDAKPSLRGGAEQKEEDIISKADSPSPVKVPPEESTHVSENEAFSDADVDMDLDDADFQKAQRNHERDLRRLEAQRPPRLGVTLRSSALASALNDIKTGGVPAPSIRKQPNRLESQPRTKHDEEDDSDVKSEPGSIALEPCSVPPTPPLEYLPFLRDSPSTPISEAECLQTPDEEDTIRDLVHLSLREERDNKLSADEDARNRFAEAFKAWRQEIDLIDATIKEEHVHEVSTPPELAFESPAPQTVRSRRLVSDYSMEAIFKESVETAAKEEQARREREERDAQVYVPADTYNPDREATVPAMLDPSEMEQACFLDFNELIEPQDVLNELEYLPVKDTFSKKEHNEFIYHYVTNPKRFGDIAEKLDGRTYKDCVRHYYATKKGKYYKIQEQKFLKTQRGKKFREANERAERTRPRGGLLATFDGAVDIEAQNAALTESGRPRRAAAPTFGESAEGEAVVPATVLPARRLTVGKDGIPGSQSTERPVARRGKTGTGQKPGRKPKAQQLLAAGPPPSSQTPSPLKDTSQAGRLLTNEPASEAYRADEQEAAQLLATLPTSVPSVPYSGPSYTEQWMAGQQPFTTESTPVHELAVGRKQEQMQVQPPQPNQSQSQPPSQQQAKSQQPSGTNSYWSVPEKTDFRNYVKYFGTDFQKIAEMMKTKTQQMIKNHYQRETDAKQGENGRKLQEDARTADEKRNKGEDLGMVPTPTPANTKRRYDSNSSRESHRPIAPIDSVPVENNPSTVRRAKTRMSPPNISSAATRITSSSQAEQKAAASSAQLLLSGPQSPRGVIHIQQPMQQPLQQRPPMTQASTSELVPEASRLSQQPRHVTEEHRPQEMDQSDHDKRLHLMAKQQHIMEQSQAEYQMRKEREHRRQQETIQRQQQEARAAEYIAHNQVRQQAQQLSAINRQDPRNIMAEMNAPRVETDEQSRRIIEQRQELLRRPQENIHRQNQSGGPSVMHQVIGRSVSHSQQGKMTQSPALSNYPPPQISRIDLTRPSSVPAPQSGPPPQPAAPPKKSSIFSVLNSEPEEPKIPKRQSDVYGGTSTPEPSSFSQKIPAGSQNPHSQTSHRSLLNAHYQQELRREEQRQSLESFEPPQRHLIRPQAPEGSRPQPQQFGRSETPSQLAAHHIQSSSLGGSMHQQHRSDPLLQSRDLNAMGRTSQLSSHERLSQQARSAVPHQPFEGPYMTSSSSSSRPISLQAQRDRGPISPPAPHSRTSSYSSLNQLTQHSHRVPPPEVRAPPTQHTAPEQRLRPSPWANISPAQHQGSPEVQIVDRPRHFSNPHEQSDLLRLDELQRLRRREQEQELMRNQREVFAQREERLRMDMDGRGRAPTQQHYRPRDEQR
ncbi:uncharacterized protein KY384_000190 [Bacidia gigantensis]|uniref:uncharacterized protein n=1 Tax=Bacidia gigantensis TaxID=2732470 RepID=UPI001D03AAD7|nr:uncharacterized protein KY384_000190 [Bacidia gigantensis]KAG8526197.1 hypothetical protein KY384_000190 [Bacidia gigantensis]